MSADYAIFNIYEFTYYVIHFQAAMSIYMKTKKQNI